MRQLIPLLLCCLSCLAAGMEQPNVLFIAADDLRVEPLALTPNLDRLAKRSRVFTNAHCQQAVCNPSRASLMTGLRPDTLRVSNLETHFRETRPGVVTLPQHFKAHGYTALNVGKIYHNWGQPIHGDPESWSAPAELHWGNHGADLPLASGDLPPNLAKDPKCECRELPDEAYIDGRIAARAIERLDGLKQAGKPFFLAVGFWKPHAPFNAPKKYWDLYQRENIPLPDPAGWPEGTDRIAWHNSPEIRGWDKQRQLGEDAVRELRHGYLAAASYLDAQLGRVLDHLDRLGLRDNTVVVFWSDHGYHLGEHTLWAKTSNFELDTRVPLLISVPGMAAPGAAAAAPVELLDLFPTLVATCGLPAVADLAGKALTPLLENPAATVKEAALSQFPRPAYHQGEPRFMGYSVRSATHRYTEWRDWATGAVKARELYAHENDPRETRNLAGLPEHAGLIANLAAILPPAAPHPPPAVAAPPPPGIVIHHQPAASGRYLGSPSLCVLPDGSYLASHDLFGPKSNEYQLATGRIYRSTDRGATWRHLTDLRGFFWTNLFAHRGAAYAMGTDKHHGRLIIRRSVDAGQTWSAPSVLAEGQWHTAPVPVVEHGGRLWRAVEDAHTSPKWGERYRARMASVPAADDLLVAANWTISNPLARDAGWLGGDFAAWLEGNAVVAPDGGMVNILRVDNSRLPEKAAMVRISGDGTTATFDPASGFIEFPGGAKKFTIRKDPAGAGYWALASVVPAGSVPAGRPAAIRNTLALVFSKDLIAWETRCLLLRHPDSAKHGFQYVDWQFEGDDLIAVCRTAWDDEQGGARNHHDANYLTFHRWRNFRQLSRADDVTLPEAGPGGK
jgi:iduronate 2-sulfatase